MLGVERSTFSQFYIRVTIFLGCGFAAKYLQGGGNFSVPLQWMLGLRCLMLDAIWLDLMPSEGSSRGDRAKIDKFLRHLRVHGFCGRSCLLFMNTASDLYDLDGLR